MPQILDVHFCLNDHTKLVGIRGPLSTLYDDDDDDKSLISTAFKHSGWTYSTVVV